MPLKSTLSEIWHRFQEELFPELADQVGPLLENHRRFVQALELVGVERFVASCWSRPGRPQQNRVALARAFVAKAVWDLPTTRDLIDRVTVDATLRRLCGWSRVGAIPSEATFSRAFAEFSEARLAERMHEALVKDALGDELVGHVSRDSTAIEGREKPAPKPEVKEEKKRRRRGRPRKGEVVAKEPSRLERQANGMSLGEMRDDLPGDCDRGTKRNAKGYKVSWTGYKLHIDTADCGVPVSAILTSASVHDSQVAIPLATMTADRVTNLYDLMDAAYDAGEIRATSERLGRIAIIDVNPRRDATLKAELKREARALRACGLVMPESVRYRGRSAVERTNARLKDEFGGRHVRVRGHLKVLGHLMFGLLALTVDQLMRLAMPP